MPTLKSRTNPLLHSGTFAEPSQKNGAPFGWIQHLSLPTAILSRNGKVLASNGAVIFQLEQVLNTRFSRWPSFNPKKRSNQKTKKSTPSLAGVSPNNQFASLAWLLKFLAQPTWLETGGEFLLKISPFSSKTVLCEWLPRPVNEPLAFLQQVSEAVNSSLILEDILESLGDVLGNYIRFDEAVIVILDDTQNGIKILVRMGPHGILDISREHNLFAGKDPVVSECLQSSSPIRYNSGAVPHSIVFIRDTISGLTVPLVNKGVVIGLIALSAWREELAFNTHQENLLSQVSDALAVAVENAKFYWQTQSQASREFLINQITRSVRQTLDIQTILETAVKELGQVSGVSRCIIQYFPQNSLRNHSTTLLDKDDVETLIGWEAPVDIEVYEYCLSGILPTKTSSHRPQHSFEWQLFQSRTQLSSQDQAWNPFILNDVADCPNSLIPKEYFKTYDIHSLAVFPILIRESLVGTITLHQCQVSRAWIEEDIQLLKAITEHLGVALYQGRLFKELENQKATLEEALDNLQQAQMQLVQSEKMAVLGQFVAGIAHEVNTPLGTITSNNTTLSRCIQKMEAELPLQDYPRSATMIESIHELLMINKMASDRMQEIVRNLRNFARLDESELKMVDVCEGIESTLLLMRSTLPPELTLIKEYQAGLPQIQCYPGLLNQVFMNLMVNALHAMEEIIHPQLTIRAQYLTDKNQLEVSFKDNGKGIRPENLPKIFDPGFTTKGVGVGTGLGLALCYRIVEKHHGKLMVSSELDEGTQFTILLPIHRAIQLD